MNLEDILEEAAAAISVAAPLDYDAIDAYAVLRLRMTPRNKLLAYFSDIYLPSAEHMLSFVPEIAKFSECRWIGLAGSVNTCGLKGFAHSLAFRTFELGSPRKAIDELMNLIECNVMDLHYVAPITGCDINIPNGLNFKDSLSVVNFADAPPILMHFPSQEESLSPSNNAISFEAKSKPTAAIVKKQRISPFFIQTMSEFKGLGDWNEVEKDILNASSAISLSTLGRGSSLGIWTSEYMESFAPIGRTSIALPWSKALHFRQLDTVPLEANLAILYFFLLSEFHKGDRPAIDFAIEKLVSAHHAWSASEILADLGIALESLMMHGESGNNAEITFKLSTRIAWLLGNTPDDRIHFFNLAKSIYALRSKAVHGGQISAGLHKVGDRRLPLDQALNEAFNLISSVLLNVLRQGKFPAWTDVMLGAHPPS